MTGKYLEKLNTFFVKSFSTIMRAEEDALATGDFKNLSYKEIHCIAAVSNLEASSENTSKSVAKALEITQGTLTVCVASLERKGCLYRERREEDKRQVFICLTDKGREMARRHKEFHDNMVLSVGGELEDEQIDSLSGVLSKLTAYFKNKGV